MNITCLYASLALPFTQGLPLPIMQLELPPYQSASGTSALAAELIKPSVSRLQALTLAVLANSVNGLTRYEIADMTNMQLQSVCARVNELLAKGQVKTIRDQNTNQKITRLSPSGRQVEVIFLSTAA